MEWPLSEDTRGQELHWAAGKQYMSERTYLKCLVRLVRAHPALDQTPETCVVQVVDVSYLSALTIFELFEQDCKPIQRSQRELQELHPAKREKDILSACRHEK